MWRKIVGVCSGFLALGSAMFLTMAIADLIGGSDTETGVLVGLAVFFGGLTASAGYGAVRLLRERRNASSTASAPTGGLAVDLSLEARILALAAESGGRVTPAEVAVRCGVSLDEASAALDSLVTRQHADIQVTPNGDSVHVLRGFLSEEEKARAEDVLSLKR